MRSECIILYVVFALRISIQQELQTVHIWSGFTVLFGVHSAVAFLQRTILQRLSEKGIVAGDLVTSLRLVSLSAPGADRKEIDMAAVLISLHVRSGPYPLLADAKS